jgi:hypothetical protein
MTYYQYLREKFLCTRAGLLSYSALGASAAIFLITMIPLSKNYLCILALAYMTLAVMLSRIEHKQKIKDLYDLSHCN